MSNTRRAATIAALVRDGTYPVDPHAVASAICARVVLRYWVPSPDLRAGELRTRIRSFHASRDASSFRLAGAGRR